MLVLARKEGESICIGEDITLTVVSVEYGRVRLGFQAPDAVKILRQELCQTPSSAATHRTKRPSPAAPRLSNANPTP